MYDGYYNQKPALAAADIAAGVPVSVEVASGANGLLALEVRVLGPAPLAPVPPHHHGHRHGRGRRRLDRRDDEGEYHVEDNDQHRTGAEGGGYRRCDRREVA